MIFSKDNLISYLKDHGELTGLVVIAVGKLLPSPDPEPNLSLKTMLFKGEKSFFWKRRICQ